MIPAGGQLTFGLPSSTTSLTLTGLTRELYTAFSVPITFTFAKAGAVTVNVPVQLSNAPGSSTLPAAAGSGD